MLTLRTYQNAADFLAVAEDFLAHDEAANNVIYGLTRAMVANAARVPPLLYLATVHWGNELLVAAEMTPPWRLLISAATHVPSKEDFAPLIQDLRAGDWQVSGVTGLDAVAAQFAEAWVHATGEICTADVHMRLFELRSVIWPSLPPGRLRAAGLADLPLVFQWYCDFRNEAHASDPLPTEDGVRRSIDGGGVFLWEDGAPVSLVVRGRTLPHGASVGPVYTPKVQRGRGYASAAVASLSQAILDSGAEFCVLFTDLANPTSNHIYQDVGYRPLCDFTEYNFAAAQGL